MKVLFDTHALFWTLRGSRRLSDRALDIINDPDSELLVSAVSGYEICFKHRLGKLPEAAALAANFEGEIASLDLTWLPIAPAHAIVAGSLGPFHRDPFDRLLAAQARVERVAIVSADDVFDRFDVERLW